MISSGLDVVGTQDSCQLLYLLTGETVDDTTLIGMLLDKLDDILIDILRLRTYLVVEVRTVERTLELCRINDTEVFLDICTYLICRRRCQGDDRCLAYLIDNRTDTTVLRTEVVTPF